MKRILLSLLIACPLSAMANSELNGDNVTASHQVNRAADPSALSVVIEFNKDGVPLAIAHSSKQSLAKSDLEKLAFAQMTLAAEDPKDLQQSTPASEKNDAQGTPQWGFAGGGIYRGPFGGTAVWGRRAWGGGWGGYGLGGYGYGYGYGYAQPYYGAGYYAGGCGGGCYAPMYYYSGCAYAPVNYWAGYGGNYYGYYQPTPYY